MFGQVARLHRLDGDRDRSVQRDAAGAVEGTLDRVTCQRVHEPVALDVVAGAIDEVVADGLIGDVEQADVAPAEHRSDDEEREMAPASPLMSVDCLAGISGLERCRVELVR